MKVFPVDRFRIFVLVGLICASGIALSQAVGEKCKVADPSAPPEECSVSSGLCKFTIADGMGAGCVPATDCPLEVPEDGNLFCGNRTDYCCCKASSQVVCNDLDEEGVLDHVCAMPDLVDKDYCKESIVVTRPAAILPPGGDLIRESATSVKVSIGTILTILSLGVFWSLHAVRIRE